MTAVLIILYLGVGLINMAYAGAQGTLMLTNPPKRRGGNPSVFTFEATLEAVLYVLLWPLQLAFWLAFGITPKVGDWLYNKIAGERRE